jgi:transcriptional regulator GlxA family with amidase domain
MTRDIAILIFDAVEEMDFVGPWEVLKAAAEGTGTRILTVARRPDPVRCEKGLRVIPDASFDQVTDPGVVLIPGGSGARHALDDAATLEWLCRVAPGCDWLTSVCTGAFLLVGSGLAAGRRVTTHHDFIDPLRALGGAEVVAGVRMVRDGNLVSAGGVMSGIEMSLWLSHRLFGAQAEAYARNYIAYDLPPRASILDACD